MKYTGSVSPVFLFTRSSYLENGMPAEHVTSVYPGVRYKVVNRLMRLNRMLVYASAASRSDAPVIVSFNECSQRPQFHAVGVSPANLRVAEPLQLPV